MMVIDLRGFFFLLLGWTDSICGDRASKFFFFCFAAPGPRHEGTREGGGRLELN